VRKLIVSTFASLDGKDRELVLGRRTYQIFGHRRRDEYLCTKRRYPARFVRE
jgi:hypothetical protein